MNANYAKRLYHQRKAAHQCVTCGKTKPKGRVQIRCAVCSVQYKCSKYVKERYVKPKSSAATIAAVCLRCEEPFRSWDRARNRFCPACTYLRGPLETNYAYAGEPL